MKYIFSIKYKWKIAAVMVSMRPPRGYLPLRTIQPYVC
jgi:hypothetical protein